MRCLQLLDSLHQRDQLPGKGIKLLEYGFGSGSLQLGPERRRFLAQSVNVLLSTEQLNPPAL